MAKWKQAKVGREVTPGVYELFVGFQAFTMDEKTKVEAGTKFGVGTPLLVTTRTGRLVSVRPFGASEADVRGLDKVLGVLEQAGLGCLGISDSSAFIVAAMAQPDFRSFDPVTAVWPRLFEHCSRFPMVWWHDDAEPGFEEMAEVLEGLSLGGAMNLEPHREAAERLLEGVAAPKDEDRAYRAVCGLLCRCANTLLAEAGEERRFIEFAAPPEEDDTPLWLLLKPAQGEVLCAGGVLTAVT